MLRNCIKENVFASVNYDFLIMRMKDLPVNEDNPAVIPPNNPVKTVLLQNQDGYSVCEYMIIGNANVQSHQSPQKKNCQK
jgi:hypothetical protein